MAFSEWQQTYKDNYTWYKATGKFCGTCMHSKYDYDDDEYYCCNEESNEYGYPTAYETSCEEWERREP